LDDTGELVIGLRLAGSLYRYWMLRGGLGEARHWLEQARAEVAVWITRNGDDVED
jgi:predicted ATPase